MHKRGKSFQKGRDVDRSVDISHQGEFMFNNTSILSSALHKLKSTQLKRPAPQQVEGSKPHKKIKPNLEEPLAPSLAYTPLQKDLYNFFIINKITLRAAQQVPQPKFEVGSSVLAAISDRGIGGKYLVANLYRNQKTYIDYTELQIGKSNEQKAVEAIARYSKPGDFVVGKVVKSRKEGHLQMSLSEHEGINEKQLRIGQVFPAQVRSKEEMGCHLVASQQKKMKVYLPKSFVSEDSFQALEEGKHSLVVIREIDQKSSIIKVSLAAEEQITLNFKGVEEEQMSKLDLDQYVAPGTLLTVKVVKVLPNGLLVKFFKIFLGYIHADHLNRSILSYSVNEKIVGRIIFACVNPPSLYLSERHGELSVYRPGRELYSCLDKPEKVEEIQGSFLDKASEFYIHGLQLHTQIQNLKKFWVKENNYFERYQIMSSRKVGIKVGDVSKGIPFKHFRVYGEGEGKFRVMCLDMWNKVIKVSYDPLLLKHPNLLLNAQVDPNIKYCGFVKSVNANGAVIQFCNNLKGIITRKQLEMNNMVCTEQIIGSGMEVYVTPTKKAYFTLSFTSAEKIKVEKEETEGEGASQGVILSLTTSSIHPIYVKLKKRLIKIDIFKGVCPASLEDLHLIKNIENNYQIGQKVTVFRKGKEYFLYPPEQLCEKELRICRVTAIQGNSLRIQVAPNQFRNCHICDITDIISPYPLNEYQIGQYTIGRLVDEKFVCLRKSIVEKGFPKNIQNCLQLYGEAEKKGDYRPRLDIMGGTALQLDSLCFGYVKNCSEKGCFVSLSRSFDIRVHSSELSDQFIKDKHIQFKNNKLVLCRLIDSKVKPGETATVMIDGSMRSSVVKYGYPLNDQILETGVGLTVSGMVTGYTKGKALVRINSSRFTGIISLQDTEGAGDSSIEKALPLGAVITCKITEYSREGEKRLIRLSTLKKVFDKYKGLETTFDASKKILAIVKSYEQLEGVPAPQTTTQPLQEVEQDQEYERLKKLLAQNQIEVEEQEQEVEQEEQQIEQEGEQVEPMEEQQQIGEQAAQEIGSLGEQEGEVKAKEAAQSTDIARRLTMLQKMPHPSSFYQSLVLANPTPESYLMYISSLLSTSTPEVIRTQFTRAISALSAVKDKDNMWISWLNTELILGDLTGTVRKAIEAGVGLAVYTRILEILCEQENWHVAIEFGKKLLKKFNTEPKAYMSFIRMTIQYPQKLPDSISFKQIVRRATQCLRSPEVLQVQTHIGKALFELGHAENARNQFEDLIRRYPKRTDLWAVYIDHEVKHGNIEKARNILERALSLNLKKKSTVTLLKKYYKIEQVHGTAESAARVLQRAEGIAQQLQEHESEDQIEDIE